VKEFSRFRCIGEQRVPIVFWTSLELDLLLTRCRGPIEMLAENSGGIEVEIHRSADAALAALGLDFKTIDDLFERGHFLPHTPVPNPSR
jgi:hypothetical protein